MDCHSARYITGSYVIAALAAVHLSACDERAVAPRISNSTTEAAARASTDLNLYTYVGSVSQIGMQWNDNARNETGWEVHRSANGVSGTFTLRDMTAADVTSYLDTALAQLTEYCYEVRAFRVTGGRKSYDTFSNVSCTTTPSLPAPPTGVRVIPGPSYADVSWTNSVSQTDSTRLERPALERVFADQKDPRALEAVPPGVCSSRTDATGTRRFDRCQVAAASAPPRA